LDGPQAAKVLLLAGGAGGGHDPSTRADADGRAPVAENPPRRAASTVTLTVVLAGGLYVAQTARNSPNGQPGHGSVPRESGVAVATDGRAPDEPRRSRTEPNEMLTKIQAAGAAVVAATMVSAAQAQQAVQWKVSDGGNGHWYQGILTSPQGSSWSVARAIAIARGADLACVHSSSEAEWLFASIVRDPSLWSGSAGPWVGGLQTSGSTEPAGGWVWVDGTSVHPTVWSAGQPDNSTVCGGDNNRIGYWNAQQGSPRPFLEDSPDSAVLECPPSLLGRRVGALIEWSADCNNDSIVDYGQIRDGTLADSNANNIPDCCESPVSCISCVACDLNPTGTVDGADLGALLAFWGPVSAAFPRADINRDGIVNGEDLGLLLANWGPCS
jgi:hypothetical protein